MTLIRLLYGAATLLLVALIATFLYSAPAAFAEEIKNQPKIHVTGEGSTTLEPDMAILSFGVMREAKTAREALNANNEAMAKVIAALKGEGIEDKDLQTSNFSINPRYSRQKGKPRNDPEIIGYRVHNNLTLRVRDLKKLGALLDKSVTLGINTGGHIRFANDDPEAALEQARIKAVKNALEKAKTLTEAAGIELGNIVEISENTARPHPRPLAQARMMEATDAAVPIAAGENIYRVTVNITIALKQ